MTVVSDLEQDWHTWHAARERDLDTDYGWLSIVAFDWLPSAPTALQGLPGQWWADERAHVSASGELTLGGEPVRGTVSASVPEAGSLSWLLYGDRLAELVLRGGRYAVRQRDPGAVTRRDFTGVPAYALDDNWLVTGYFSPYPKAQRLEVTTARDDLRQHVIAVGTVHVALGDRAYELVATAAGDSRLNLSFHDQTNGAETAPWRTVTTGPVARDGSVSIDFNRAINLPFAFTAYGTCPAPVPGNRIDLPVTAGEKKVR
ncbi:DUF1684 domain-containing protein [Kribbella solani]|uniref:DUF1684 domain-containing protein n=1 Tax=Kribbella solani TaxID=236067 RepID=UPI0029A07AE0|nr:DUF1684 domain-containing protein [Kribbella solani]MDX3000872.1 DUF1684 domain-containing protein [Kribbella solani]